ncbi:MAG: rhomboid family intramembrane serine protease [Acidobacteriales bacterium]|nr:rhomboid family intramembrane serine protease [Terriglobales bacterium]
MIPLRDSQPSYSTPYVTIALIVTNVLVFLYTVSLDPFSRNHFILEYGMIPARFQLIDLFTSIFLHGGWLHLIGNMWFLWIYGDNVEDVLGHGKYLLFYLLCGLAASLGQYMLNMDSRVPTVGASGAIAGVMGAYLVKFPHARIVTLVPVFIFFTTFEIPAVLILVYWFVIQFFSGVGSIATSQASQGGVAWFAHVAGFLAGAVLVLIMGRGERYKRRRDLYW